MCVNYLLLKTYITAVRGQNMALFRKRTYTWQLNWIYLQFFMVVDERAHLKVIINVV